MEREELSLLEYDRILSRIASFAHSEPTRSLILSLTPFRERGTIEHRFAIFSEIDRLHSLDIDLRIDDFPDVRPLLERVRPQGSILGLHELLEIGRFLSVVSALRRQIAYRTDIPVLKELLGGLDGYDDLREAIDATIDDGGEIKDTASAELKRLRERKRTLTARIRKRLEEIVREREVAIFLQDDFVTQRSGRWVIPVRMDSKGMVPGVVHDVSNTGETAFVEPVEIVPLANELENLVAEERAEMIRILRQLTGWIRESAEGMAADFSLLVTADQHCAVAQFAFAVGGRIPQIGDGKRLSLKGGKHPLLVMKGGEVVPLDLTLDDGRRILVITGPNTGGKTVALKTVGLLTLMALTGIPIPASEETIVPLVDHLLADIGDDQSIDENLSTFSSHLRRITRILHEAGERSLVLMDELGTGTDPSQGGALSCAILEALRDRGSFVVATTHLAQITAFVHAEEGMENGSMLFDPATLAPTYRLRIGTPGGSHAFETARRCGFPQEVIDRAVTLSDDLSVRFHRLVEQLSREIARYRERSTKLESTERELNERLAELGRREEELERKGRETRLRALEEARDLVSSTRREMNRLLEEMRRERSRVPLKELARVEEEIVTGIDRIVPRAAVDPDVLKPGDLVEILSLGVDAPVRSVDRKGGRVRVEVRGKELDIPLDAVGRPSGRGVPRHPAKGRATHETVDPTTTLTVIGKRVEEAIPLVERFLDQALMGGVTEVRVIHGKGTGLLRRGIREYLAGCPHVRSFRDGEPFEGGSGLTVVELE